MELLLDIENVSKTFSIRNPFRLFSSTQVQALKEISFGIKEGLTTSIIGESGSGKTTLANIIIGQLSPDTGKVRWKDTEIKGHNKKIFAQKLHVVFQNPASSLNPRMSVFNIIAEPLKFRSTLSKKEIFLKVIEILDAVKLGKEIINRFPHELSGGEKQRVSIARAIISHPEIIILDEPVSSLDISVRAQILNLLKDLKQKYKLTYIFISHDMATTRFISDEIIVLYRGRIMEKGNSESIFKNPQSPYTKLLLYSVPNQKIIKDFQTVSRKDLSPECPFFNRCPLALEICKYEFPKPKEISENHSVMCHAV